AHIASIPCNWFAENLMTMMNARPLTRAATISLLVGLLAIITTAQTPEAIPKTDPVARPSTALEPRGKEEIQQGRLPGFALCVVRNGKLIYAKGFGVAKLGGSMP